MKDIFEEIVHKEFQNKDEENKGIKSFSSIAVPSKGPHSYREAKEDAEHWQMKPNLINEIELNKWNYYSNKIVNPYYIIQLICHLC